MSGNDAELLEERRRALEDAFYAEQDSKLLDKMRGELRALEARRQLAHVSGIAEEKVLQDLMDLGIRAEAVAAMGLIPMIEVAWSDGAVSDDERTQILRFADQNGIKAKTAGHALLEQWLKRRPASTFLKSWKGYVAELVKVMPKDSYAKVRALVLERCSAVAGASGGFLGMGKVSQAEQQKIDEITHALGK